MFSYVFVCLAHFNLGVDEHLFLTFNLICYLCVLSLVLLTSLFDWFFVYHSAKIPEFSRFGFGCSSSSVFWCTWCVASLSLGAVSA